MLSVSAAPPARCVVIDAGHGGKDPGTVRGSFYEKNINLAVAKAAGEIIVSSMPNINVVYTRQSDKFVELSERTTIANRANADLFISIHTNANPNRNVSGTETYIMGVDKSKANLEVAMRENGVISLESHYGERYEGYDPQSSESLIMFSLMQYSFQRESIALAQLLQNGFADAGRANRGVKQAGFLVLWRTSMPSILTELGYLSNEREARYMLSAKGQTELAQSIANAAIKYLESCDKVTVKGDNKMEPIQNPKFKIQNSSHYGVQIKSSTVPIVINSMNFGPYVMSIREHHTGNYYKYVVGELFLYKEALLLRNKLQETYLDAFIVAFDQNGGQITVSQAQKTIEK